MKRWGYCNICNVPLLSEQHANDHVNEVQHQSNEAALDALEAQQVQANTDREPEWQPVRNVSAPVGQERGPRQEYSMISLSSHRCMFNY